MPRPKVFTAQNVVLTLSSGDTGVASQTVADLTGNLESKIGSNIRSGITASRVWIRGFWGYGATAAVSPVDGMYSLGVARARQGMDPGDFGDLGNHEGDLMASDNRTLREPLDTYATMVPSEGAWMSLDGRSQRKMQRAEDTLAIWNPPPFN